MVQKTTNFVVTFVKLGVAILLIGSLLWLLNQALPRTTPGRSPGETPGLLVPSATPTLKATPTEAESKRRTEVITYTIRPGDTSFRIAEKFQLKPESILWGNYEHLAQDPHNLQPGMELNILPVDGVYYEWMEADNLNEVASRFGVRPEDIIDWPGNHLNAETLGDWSKPNIAPGAMLVIPGGQREFVPWSAPRDPG